MKKLLGCFLCAMLLVFGTTTSVQAISILNYGDADSLVAQVDLEPPPGDEKSTEVNWAINEWNDYYDGDPMAVDDDYPLPVAGESFVYSPFNAVPSGTVYWTGDYQYLTVKYSTYFDLFYIEGLSGEEGVYFTGNGENAISHVRLWNPVPEPATMFLLGAGFVVLAGIGRKKFVKK